ncbi:regulator of G-protein signaling egl-10-like [Metopolophium dirhodum]|uniref:regulator of G-protein signaling egl-10-like n=1 Tax=Metopolophium dirhodum TaxID=44670 RepID=UPI00298FC9A5|nr:regulator of G-protein signaling egl-10-like [Metopolophium dirhodum]
MLRYIKKRLMSFFKILKIWITRESANNSDWSIELPFNLSEDSASNLLVDSLVHLQDVSFSKIPPTQMVRKLKREYIEVLNHIINIKVSDLINRMNNKVKRVPLNTIVKCARVIFPRIEINGGSLLLWFINTMDFDADEALYMTNLLSSHIIMFTILNHYLTVLNVGYFYRNLSSSSRITYKARLNDYNYAVYLCKKEIEENIHGDLLNYKVKKSAKAKVDVNKWEFKFIPSDYKLPTSNNTIPAVAKNLNNELQEF